MMRPGVQRRLDIEQLGSVTVVRLLDIELVRPDHIDALGVRLLRVADELGCRRVVLDLARLERLGSSLIGKILGLYKRLRAVGGRLALCNLNPRLCEVLELLRVATLLSIYPSERAAVQALEAGSPPAGAASPAAEG
jgi:anti-sigma B factor antagonist